MRRIIIKSVVVLHYVVAAVIVTYTICTWNSPERVHGGLIGAFFALLLLRLKLESDEARAKYRRIMFGVRGRGTVLAATISSSSASRRKSDARDGSSRTD